MAETAKKPRKPKQVDCIYCGDCKPVWDGQGAWHCEVDGGAWAVKYTPNQTAEGSL